MSDISEEVNADPLTFWLAINYLRVTISKNVLNPTQDFDFIIKSMITLGIAIKYSESGLTSS